MTRMPVVFAGHGTPMNAIEKNEFTAEWERIGAELPRPRAILCVSAHWYVAGTRVQSEASPRMIYDMYGFPEELYRVLYPAPGSPQDAARIAELSGGAIRQDATWGFDHGMWSVLRRMFPEGDIPCLELSVDRTASAEDHYRIGRLLTPLRDDGVLIVGSGNIVHNLGRVDWNLAGGYPWAEEFDGYIRERVLKRTDDSVIHFERAGDPAAMSFRTMDHFAPLLYALGASDASDPIRIFCNRCVLGSLSMTGYVFG